MPTTPSKSNISIEDMTTELEQAREKVAKLEQEESDKIWTSKENIARYVLSTIEATEHEGKPNVNSKGHLVHRMPLSVLCEIVNHLGLEGFTAPKPSSKSQKYVNLVKTD